MLNKLNIFQHVPSHSFHWGGGAHLSSSAAFNELAAAVNDLAEESKKVEYWTNCDSWPFTQKQKLKSPGQKESGDWAAPTHRSTQQSQKSYSKRWAMVNILYIAPSHQILKSVLSFFRFWYISKCYRFWRVYYINVFQTPAQFLKNKDVSNTSNTTLH